MTDLKVAEMFYTIQGEGPNTGQPAIFLRLAGCNLRCGAVGRDLDDVNPIEDEPTEGASWICDTIPEWKEADFTYSPQELVDEFTSRGWVANLEDGAHLVLTGGEPTLPQHQEAFVEFVKLLEEQKGVSPFVEVETNGTIQPKPEFDQYVSQFNVSLKLSNSGHDEERRLDHEVIDWHVWRYLERHQMTGIPSVFKFVVGQGEDVAEIEQIVAKYNIPDGMIMLMPAGQTREQLAQTYPVVAELVKEKGWRFSPRLHVSVWNEQTGV